ESGKGLGNADVQLFGDDALDLVEGKGLDAVLETRDRAQGVRWRQIGASGKQLPDFDEGGAELFQIMREVIGGDVGVRLTRRQLVRIESRVKQQIGSALFEQQPRDLVVATNVIRPQRQAHR